MTLYLWSREYSCSCSAFVGYLRVLRRSSRFLNTTRLFSRRGANLSDGGLRCGVRSCTFFTSGLFEATQPHENSICLLGLYSASKLSVDAWMLCENRNCSLQSIYSTGNCFGLFEPNFASCGIQPSYLIKGYYNALSFSKSVKFFVWSQWEIQFENQALVEPTLEFHGLEKGPITSSSRAKEGNLRRTMDRGGSSGG